MTRPRGDRALLWGLVGVAVAVPAALAIESLLRALILPPDFELLREAWGPDMTPWAWRLVPVAAVVDVAAFILQVKLQRRAAAIVEATQQRWKRFEGLMIAASVAQIPGLLAAIAFMVGADLCAVLVAIGVSTAGVVAIAVTVLRVAR